MTPSRTVVPRHRRGQSAVETVLLMPVIMMVFMAMYYLFTITFAAQNAHLRAREYALHGDTYLGGRSHGTTGSSAFGFFNYQKAERGITPFRFSGTATDRSIDGTSTSGGVTVTATAVIGG